MATTQQRHPSQGGSDRYQLASDGYDGVARSGVIRSDGKWVPCEAGNPDWHEYCDWVAASDDNNPAPFRAPRDGGVAIKLDPNQSAVGSMRDSVDDDDMPQPPPPPRRVPHRADLYNPPVVPTDASHSPARDQRSDAYRPLSDEERKAREEREEWNRTHPATVEGEWTQEDHDQRRRRNEDAMRAHSEAMQQHQGTQRAADEARSRSEEEQRQFENAEAARRQPQAHPQAGSASAPAPSQPQQPQHHTTRSDDKRK